MHHSLRFWPPNPDGFNPFALLNGSRCPKMRGQIPWFAGSTQLTREAISPAIG